MSAAHLQPFLPWQQEFTALRRDLHRHPETAFEERRTAAIVKQHLLDYGLEVHEGLADTGVVGILRRGASTRAIGLRADMDALHLDEENTFDHRSTHTGKMHGCGHDGHTVMLLAAARALAAQDDLDGTIYFIFQPAEENEGGAKRMIEDGLFERFPMQAVFGLHNMPGIKVGHFAIWPGAMMAGLDIFDIEITGTGAHAAMPQFGQDTILAASHLVAALHSIVPRALSPTTAAVLSVTQLHAGATYNVLPENARLGGTVRFFDVETQTRIERRMQEVCDGMAQSFGVKVQLRYDKRYPPTINSEQETALCVEVLRDLYGTDRVDTHPQPLMAAEDFAWMLTRLPGAYVWAGNGTGSEGGCMVHNPRYDFNDELIPHGAAYWVALARRALHAT